MPYDPSPRANYRTVLVWSAIGLVVAGCGTDSEADQGWGAEVRGGLVVDAEWLPAPLWEPTASPKCSAPGNHAKCASYYCTLCDQTQDPNACGLCSPACGASGAVQWEWSHEPEPYVTQGYTHNERGYDVNVGPDGQVGVATGAYVKFPGQNGFSEGGVYSLSSYGQEQWRHAPGISGPYHYWFGMARDAEDKLMVVGNAIDILDGPDGLVLRAYDPIGNVAWEQASVTHEGTSNALGFRGLHVTQDEVVVVARTDTWTFERRFQSDGTPTSAVDLYVNEGVVDFGVDGAGNTVTGGVEFATGEFLLHARGPDGTELWSAKAADANGVSLSLVGVDMSLAGSVAVVGDASGPSSSLLQVYDSGGTFRWRVGTRDGSILAILWESFVDVSFSPDGTVVVTGSGEYVNGSEYAFVRKFGHYGQELWTTWLDTTEVGHPNRIDVGQSCAIAVSGAIPKVPAIWGGGPPPLGTLFDVPTAAALEG